MLLLPFIATTGLLLSITWKVDAAATSHGDVLVCKDNRYKGLEPSSDVWCQANCNMSSPRCPPDLCVCANGADQKTTMDQRCQSPLACSPGLYRAVPGTTTDLWCQTNCMMPDANCPCTMCECGANAIQVPYTRGDNVGCSDNRYSGITPDKDEWCQRTCNQPSGFLCPPSLCKCTNPEAAVFGRCTEKRVCKSGHYRATLGTTATDPWCNATCNHDPPDCPCTLCECGTDVVPSTMHTSSGIPTPTPGPSPPTPTIQDTESPTAPETTLAPATTTEEQTTSAHPTAIETSNPSTTTAPIETTPEVISTTSPAPETQAPVPTKQPAETTTAAIIAIPPPVETSASTEQTTPGENENTDNEEPQEPNIPVDNPGEPAGVAGGAAEAQKNDSSSATTVGIIAGAAAGIIGVAAGVVLLARYRRTNTGRVLENEALTENVWQNANITNNALYQNPTIEGENPLFNRSSI